MNKIGFFFNVPTFLGQNSTCGFDALIFFSPFTAELSPAVCPSFRTVHVPLNNSDQKIACGTHPALCKAFLHS